VAAALSFVACAWPAGILWFLPWRLISGVSGGALMVLATSSILARTPSALRGRVSGIIFTGVGLGITAAGTLVPALARLGLTVTWLALGAVSAILTLLIWRSWPAEPRPEASTDVDAEKRHASLGPIALLIVIYVCDAAGFVPHSIFWIDYIARGLGRGLGVGGLYWVAFGAGAAVGPLLAGFLADRIGLARSLFLALVAKALAVTLPVFLEDAVGLALSSLIVGAMTPAVPALISGRVVELMPPAEVRRAWAWLTIAFAVAQTVAAYGLSFLFARFGSYHLLFAIGGVSLGLAAALALVKVPRRRP
jgi:predicted MFS family arabinose efflux permease